jgi:hypothetical protein
MKNMVERTLAALLLGVLSLGHTAHAQRITQVIKVDIPFEFSVGGQTFSAGRYSLVSTAPSVLQLRDADDHALTTVLTNSVQTLKGPASPKLQFRNQDGQRVLVQVWQADDSIGQQLQPPKSLIQVAKQRSKRVQTAEVGKPQ